MPNTPRDFCGRTRREFLWQTGGGFAGTALAALLGEEFFARQTVAADGVTPFRNPLAPRQPHHEPAATSCIFLFMYGGPSHVDTFDYKPDMYGRDNQVVEVKTFGRGGHKNQGRIVVDGMTINRGASAQGININTGANIPGATLANLDERRVLNLERPEAQIGPLAVLDTGGTGSYHGLLTSIRRRAAGGGRSGRLIGTCRAWRRCGRSSP